MTQSLLTNAFRLSSNASAYYLFVGRHIEYGAGDASPDQPLDSVQKTSYEIYDNMLYGRRVLEDDSCRMIKRYTWTSGVPYVKYDHETANLFNQHFYTVVDTGSGLNVYKCLDNNNGANSTVQPSGTDNDPVESPSDGYVWKYMYTANTTLVDKFATNEYIPIVNNANVVSAAVDGAIEVIEVTSGGLGYDNYITSQFNTSEDVRVGGDDTQYAIGDGASATADFYNGCMLLITTGAAANEYRIITDYQIVGSQKIVTIDRPFTNSPSVNDQFEITPNVYVYDVGGQMTINCAARAIVNSQSGNSISKIEVLAPGAGYRAANTVIQPAGAVGVEADASLRPIIGPPGGHGSNPVYELNGSFIGIGVAVSSGSGIDVSANDFRQIGLLRNPQYANVGIVINESNTVGQFVVGETIFTYEPYKMVGTVEVSSTNNVVGGTGTSFGSLVPGDSVLITDGDSNFFGSVNAVSTSASLTVSSNIGFTSNTATISYLRTSNFGKVSSTGPGIVYATDVNTDLTTRVGLFVGQQSMATTQANTDANTVYSVNGIDVGNFDSFIQTPYLEGSIVSGTFQEDEVIKQTTGNLPQTPSARVYKVEDTGLDDKIYVTNVLNTFTSNNTIAGDTSGATFSFGALVPGFLKKDSGQVVYVENVNPITVASNSSIQFKLILEF